jgi:hypothetical protein
VSHRRVPLSSSGRPFATEPELDWADRHRSWRRIVADYEAATNRAPDGFKSVVWVRLRSRPEPLELGFVRTSIEQAVDEILALAEEILDELCGANPRNTPERSCSWLHTWFGKESGVRQIDRRRRDARCRVSLVHEGGFDGASVCPP